RPGHQLRLRGRAAAPRPAGEEHDVVRARLPLSTAQASSADLVHLLARSVRVATDRDQARAAHRDEPRTRRTSPYATSVPATVRTSWTARLPCSFDSPLTRSRMSTGTSTTLSPPFCSRSNDSTSGAPLSYGTARIGIARALTAYIPLVASWNGPPSAAFIPRRKTAVPNRRLGRGS